MCFGFVAIISRGRISTTFPLAPYVRANESPETVTLLMLEEKYLVTVVTMLWVLSLLGPDILHTLDDRYDSS